jgi:ribosomal protein L37AE/L43A
MTHTHLHDCNTSGCDGCQPCAERHCALCGREHVTVEGRGADQTCTTCLAAVRDDLRLIVELHARMLTEATHRGVNSEATVLAGPAADVETWNRRGLLIAAQAAHADDLSPAADRLRAWAEDCRDEAHPLWVLGSWDMLVREHYDQPSDITATVANCRDYLDGHLTRLAHDVDFAFNELAREVRQCRGHMEDVLHDGIREDRGAPCPACGRAALVKAWGESEDQDRWTCPKCGQWWDEGTYRTKVAGIYIGVAKALTASQIRTAYRIPEGTVRRWASEGTVRKRGRDDQGITLYDVDDTLAMRDGVTSAQVP